VTRRSTGWLGALALTGALTACAVPAEPARSPAEARSAVPPSSPEPSLSPMPEAAAPSPPAPPAPAAPAEAGTAAATLATLAIKGRAPKTGYDRDLFGQAWADVDRNGCDTRNDILARDLTAETFRPGTGDCVVITGTLADPYTARTLSFVKADASAVQIDHVVALSDAWQKGAQQWDASRRLAFANDPLNLLAVDGPTNASKSDGDAATWLPPNKAYRCPMVARQVAVKATYGLWVTQAERDAIDRVLTGCPGEPLPEGQAPPPVVAAAPPPAAPSPPPPAAASGADPDYGTCAEAKANGAGPYQRGEPEYAYYRDGDSDGTVCE